MLQWLSDAAAAGKKVTFVCDSIGEQGRPGFGTGAGAGVGFTTFIQQAFPGAVYNNLSIGGKTTADLLTNEPGWLASVLATDADIYGVGLGTNDSRYNDSRGAATQAAYIANITAIVAALKAPKNAKIILFGIWPTFWKDQYSNLLRKATDERVDQWNNALATYAASATEVACVVCAPQIRAAVNYNNVTALLPDHIHPDYGSVAAKKMYAEAVLAGDIQNPAAYAPGYVPASGTRVGYLVRVLSASTTVCQIKMLKLLPYFKETFGFSADPAIGMAGLFGSYSAGYAGYKNKISDFPFDFIITADQEASGIIHLSLGQMLGIRGFEVYRSTNPDAWVDPKHQDWQLLNAERSTTAVAFDLLPKMRDGVFYKIQFDGSNGTDGTGGTTGQYIKVSKIWLGVNPIRFALQNPIATSTGPYERVDLVFSAAGGSASAHISNVLNTYPFSVLLESPHAVPSIVLGDVGEAGRGIAGWKIFVSANPDAIGDPAHTSWVQILTGTGAGTASLPWPHV